MILVWESIIMHFENDFKVKLHPLLADSLVVNLLGNAVKYNYTGGRIKVMVSDYNFHISNTSLLMPMHSGKLFKRFNTSKDAGETSNGLGLAIV